MMSKRVKRLLSMVSETLNNYEKGNYVLKAKFKFSRNENMTNLIEYALELPLTIK